MVTTARPLGFIASAPVLRLLAGPAVFFAWVNATEQ